MGHFDAAFPSAHADRAECEDSVTEIAELRVTSPRRPYLSPRRSDGWSPRSPATSAAQYPAGSGVGVSVLLRQPHGFEGLRTIHEIMLPHHQATAQGRDLVEPCADGHTAPGSAPAEFGGDEQVVSKVEGFLRVESNVLGDFENQPPSSTEAVVAVVGAARVGEQVGKAKLDAGIKIQNEHVEVASIKSRICLPDTTRKDRAAQPRVAWQSRPRGTQLTGKRREADDDPFTQGPVSPRFASRKRDSDGSRGLDVLLRHRPRSIPQAQESA
jgi:hypothetical protein